jgi:hypothetical protein
MKFRILAGVIATLCAPLALAHGDHSPGHGKGERPPPAAVLQLEQVREATARFLDVERAEAEGYQDIALFVPNMGWHYMKEKYVDGRFDLTRPELLVYADDPCGGKRRLVAVEYAVPYSLARRPPAGFHGAADRWDANRTYELWTLHAWLFEYNPDGVFAPMNPRVP